MPQLSDLIQAGRSAGKTDDEIWKELSSQGWADADISQALGGVVSPNLGMTPVSPAPVAVAGGGMSSVAVGLSVLGVILLGAGVYYVITSSSRTVPLKSETPNRQIATSPAPQNRARNVSCSDLLSIADVQRFTQNGSSVEVELDDSSSGLIACSFTQETSSIAVTVSTGEGISAGQLYDITRSTWASNVETARAQGRDTSKLEVKDVQGIGMKAFSAVVAFMPTIGVLSADGQTFFTVGTLSDAAAVSIQEIAKLIEVNVSKF